MSKEDMNTLLICLFSAVCGAVVGATWAVTVGANWHPNEWGSGSDQIIAFGTVLSAIALIISFVVAGFAIVRAHRTQRYGVASRLWDSYLDRALRYPKFAFPDSFSDDFEFDKKRVNGSRKEFERYEWYVSALLRTAEEVLDEFDSRHSRTETTKFNIEYHARYLVWRRNLHLRDDYIDRLSPKVRALVDDIVMHHNGNSDFKGLHPSA